VHSLGHVRHLNLGYNRIKRHGLEALIGIADVMEPGFKLYLTGNNVSDIDSREIFELIEATEKRIKEKILLSARGVVLAPKSDNYDVDARDSRDTSEDFMIHHLEGEKYIFYGPKDLASPVVLTDKYTFPKCKFEYNYVYGSYIDN
jgi:hypothetical protein